MSDKKNEKEKDTGFLYCFENECMPGLLKIGFTNRTIKERLSEANSSGTFGPPSDYTVVCAKSVLFPHKKEAILHALLSNVRKNPRKEFFVLNREKIKLFFDLIDGDDWNGNEIEIDKESDEKNATLFLNSAIYASTNTSAPVTTKLLTETFAAWKEKTNLKVSIHYVQKLLRDSYGPPTSKGWTQISIRPTF
jgi:hypothetical protein